LAFGFLVERGGEHTEVSAGGALVPEEALADLEFKTPFGPVLGFAILAWELVWDGGESRVRVRVLGFGYYGVEEKW
jgi:hypothetical protein